MDYSKMDLHMHSTVSDGTDPPAELLQRVREAGIPLFAVTDHDAMKACGMIREIRTEEDPYLISGVEFSCRDEMGSYHILGYGIDTESRDMQSIVAEAHWLRMEKVYARLDFLKETFGIFFPKEEVQHLLTLENPGKPHIGNLMVKYGYAKTKEEAIHDFINQFRFRAEFIRPEAAIQAILQGGGIPVLAHPPFGNGEQMIRGEAMDDRLRRLIGFGLLGMEAFYSGFTPEIRDEMLDLAAKYDLYITAGSDYHGRNKPVRLGDTGLQDMPALPDGMKRFLEAVLSGRKTD